MKEGKFAVVVRFDDHSKPSGIVQDVQPPLVYWHNKPKAAARRLTAIINRKASWVPKCVASGFRFYIVDHTSSREVRQFSLNDFKAEYGLTSL